MKYFSSNYWKSLGLLKLVNKNVHCNYNKNAKKDSVSDGRKICYTIYFAKYVGEKYFTRTKHALVTV